jgi:hypothetical protein
MFRSPVSPFGRLRGILHHIGKEREGGFIVGADLAEFHETTIPDRFHLSGGRRARLAVHLDEQASRFRWSRTKITDPLDCAAPNC